jgi:hypothetical protein
LVEGIELHNVSKMRGLMLYLQQKATFYPSFKARWIKPLAAFFLYLTGRIV